MTTLTITTILLILTIIAIVVSEICLSIENHDLTDQLNEQIRINKYLGDRLNALTKRIEDFPKYTEPATTTILPTQE